MECDVVVTGGAGYLGSVLVPLLLDRGHRVTVVDRMTFGGIGLAGVMGHPALKVIVEDVAAPALPAQMFANVDAVIHLAGVSSPAACDAVGRVAEDFNVSATQRLVGLAASEGVRLFVHASTCGVYGPTAALQADETSATAPDSLYARTKLAAEVTVLNAGRDQMLCVVLRLATLYGLAPQMRFDLVVNTMVRDAVRDGRIHVDGTGREWRPLLHVRDAAQAFVSVLEAPEGAFCSEVFNVADELANVQMNELAQRIAVALGPLGAAIRPLGVAVDRRAPLDANNGHPDGRTAMPASPRSGYRVSSGKVNRQLGFFPKQELEPSCVEIARAVGAGMFDDCPDDQHNAALRWQRLTRIPAIDGGLAIRDVLLPLAIPTIGEDEVSAVAETLRSGWLTRGPRVGEFETELAFYLGVSEVVAVSSCTAALQIALAALEIGPGDEVITSTITFPSTANVILQQGARPVLVDIDAGTLNLDPERVRAAITPRTKAVIPVHLAGQPADMDRIWDLAEYHGFHVVEDAAHALGAEYHGKRVGGLSRSTAACFSFYPTKNITTIEGGALATNNKRLAALARIYSNHGLSVDAWSRHGAGRPAAWETRVAGFKANMTDVQAALGREQLSRLDGFLLKRKHLATLYQSAFGSLDALDLPSCLPSASQAWHLFVVLLRTKQLSVDRDGFRNALRRENIASGIHFPPLHLQRYYRDRLRVAASDFPRATEVAKRLLSLPLFPGMGDGDVGDVVDAVRKLSEAYARPRAEAPYRDLAGVLARPLQV